MKKINKRIVSADQVADMADEGRNVFKYFANKGKMKHPRRQDMDPVDDEMV